MFKLQQYSSVLITDEVCPYKGTDVGSINTCHYDRLHLYRIVPTNTLLLMGVVFPSVPRVSRAVWSQGRRRPSDPKFEMPKTTTTNERKN